MAHLWGHSGPARASPCVVDSAGDTAKLLYNSGICLASLEGAGGVFVKPRKPPVGFEAGYATGNGNNCLISTPLQLVTGRREVGPRATHDKRCASVRAVGAARGVWPGDGSYLTACCAAVREVCRQAEVRGTDRPARVVLYSGDDHAQIVQVVRSDHGSGEVSGYNPGNVHFVPLWPE